MIFFLHFALRAKNVGNYNSRKKQQRDRTTVSGRAPDQTKIDNYDISQAKRERENVKRARKLGRVKLKSPNIKS
jgi:hypothetical protein